MTGTDGLLIVDKPARWTSHDVVARVRRLAGTRRVGHAGTLDPLATGVLVLGVGRGTRLLTFLVGCDKTYAATIRLGQATDTDDAHGTVTSTVDTAHLTREDVVAAATALTGPLQQVPSTVSAVKVAGERSYALARRGKAVPLAARDVTVHRFDVRAVRHRTVPTGEGRTATVVDVDAQVEVSAGTYVRALARDLGRALAVGGHVTALRRTRVGRFAIDRAVALPELERRAGGHLPVLDLTSAAVLQFPVRRVTAQQARALSHGQSIPSTLARSAEPVAALGPDGRLVALLDESAAPSRARVVFASGGS